MTDLGTFKGKNYPASISDRPPTKAVYAAFFVALCLVLFGPALGALI
jgi:hypothetical protein